LVTALRGTRCDATVAASRSTPFAIRATEIGITARTAVINAPTANAVIAEPALSIGNARTAYRVANAADKNSPSVVTRCSVRTPVASKCTASALPKIRIETGQIGDRETLIDLASDMVVMLATLSSPTSVGIAVSVIAGNRLVPATCRYLTFRGDTSPIAIRRSLKIPHIFGRIASEVPYRFPSSHFSQKIRNPRNV
jgi:hypothetical protein